MGGVSFKACKSCVLVRYCNANCQRNHWPKHKKECKQVASERRDEALFKDPPAKEDCPICFLPMPLTLICCISLPPATITSVPIYDYALANEELAKLSTEQYYECCGKRICRGCIESLFLSNNDEHCPYCKAERKGKTDEDKVEELLKRVEVNDTGSMYVLGTYYFHGELGLHQDQEKAMTLYARAADLGYSKAHFCIGVGYDDRHGGDLKKAKFHFEAAAMAGDEVARCKLGYMEFVSGNMDRALKHCTIAASSGSYTSMHALIKQFENGFVSRESLDSTLAAYNNSCAEMRSKARDAYIHAHV